MLKLCLTGGPGSGKTVVFNHLAQMLEERGYHVFFVPETESELVLNGIKPNKYISQVAFYNFVLNKQLDKEKLYDKLANYYPKNSIVIVYDRGIMDIGTSLEKSTFAGMLEKRRMDEQDACSHYDAVLHLVTAADGAEQFYQWNDPHNHSALLNLATESPEKAIEKDKATQSAWANHPNLHIVKSTINFSDKLKKVIDIVFNLLGEAPPTHNVRKFIIKRPTQVELAELGCIFKTNIVQTYLKKYDARIDRRVMQRGTKEDGFMYYYIEKVDMGSGEEQFVTEQRITQQEYQNYLKDADQSIKSMSKTRQCFLYNNRYHEIDIFPFDSNYAILEIEKEDADYGNFTPFTIINEVTNNPDFSSRNLAEKRQLAEKPIESGEVDQWTYETGREEKGLGPTDSRFYSVEMTANKQEAIKMFAERNRTYLIRYRNINGTQQCQWYDPVSLTWNEN